MEMKATIDITQVGDSSTELVVTVTHQGQLYRARLSVDDLGTVDVGHVDSSGHWTDNPGTWDGRAITDCSADLPEDVYDLLSGALREGSDWDDWRAQLEALFPGTRPPRSRSAPVLDRL